MTTKFGRVKWFNNTRGFGFITNIDNGYDENETSDVFVHHSRISITGDGYRTLHQGEYIQYVDYVDENGKSCADNVTGVKGGPLLCELNRSRGRKHHDHQDPQDHQDEQDVN